MTEHPLDSVRAVHATLQLPGCHMTLYRQLKRSGWSVNKQETSIALSVEHKQCRLYFVQYWMQRSEEDWMCDDHYRCSSVLWESS